MARDDLHLAKRGASPTRLGPSALNPVLLVGLVYSVAACAGDALPSRAEQRDSAGVTIVESSGPQWREGEAWHVDSEPILELTGTGPAYEFNRVPDATRLEDGRFVVLDAGSFQVRFFDPAGVFLRAVGQEGEGPGDFQVLANVERFRGDSLLVFDSWLGRATIFDAAGAIARVLTLPVGIRGEELYPVTDGTLMAATWSLDDLQQLEGAYRASYRVVSLSADGVVQDTIATVAGWNGYMIHGEGGGYRDIAPLFIVDGHVVADASGLVTGAADRMEFRRYSRSGVLEQIVRVPPLDEALTDAEIDAERASMIRPQSSAEFRRIVAGLPAPEMRPAYSDLLRDAEGFVWLAHYWSRRRQGDRPVLWHIFDARGAWLGDLTTPARFSVLEAGKDYLLGVRRDSLDVEHVQVLRLSR